MQIDKKFCSSSFLMYRTIIDLNKAFSNKYKPNFAEISFTRSPVYNENDLYFYLKQEVEMAISDGKCAIALSGGMDSAILATMMPKGSTAYTFKCVVPGIEVIDETKMAAIYAERCGLQHKIIEIYWEDFLESAPLLMKHKGMPIHSIEVQIYKAALEAKKDGFEKIIFGENADIIYGGMNELLSKDWLIGEFIDRYSYVLPYKVLKEPEIIIEPFQKYELNGHCDANAFINEYFRWEALGTYNNACETAGIQFVGPFSRTDMKAKLDLARIRSGDTKYLVREVFHKLYKDIPIQAKIPMPRATNEWLKDWNGPQRLDFYPHCTDDMTGDQKWIVMALEMFLNILESEDKCNE